VARARNIKPGFFKNETLAECPPLVRLLFAGLWCLADRAGRLEDRPKRIRAEILPYDDGNVDDMLNELQRAGFILRYQVGEQRFIQVLNFAKHQNPHCREPESTVPAPDEPGASPADSLNLIPEKNISSPPGDPLACPIGAIIDLYHRAMPGNPRCKVLNQARRGAIKARWREASSLTCKPFGYNTQDAGLAAWRVFFETCNESLFLTGRITPQQGKPPFLADIDFLMSASGFAKVIENKYHRNIS
jgi:hypothetical protein